MNTWQVQKPIVLEGHEAAIYSLCPWEDSVLSGAGDGWLVQWPLDGNNQGKLLARFDDRIFCMLSPKQAGRQLLVVGTMTGDLYWLDLKNPEQPKRWRFHQEGIFALLDLGSIILAAGADGRISRWQVENAEMLDFVQVDPTRIRSMIHLPDRKQVVAGTGSGDLIFLNEDSLQEEARIVHAHELSIFSLAYLHGQIFSAGRDAQIRWWSVEAPRLQKGFVSAHNTTVNSLSWHAEAGLLVSAGRDRELRCWAPKVNEEGDGVAELVLTKVLKAPREAGHLASVNCCLWIGDQLISGSDDRTLRIWNWVRS